MIIYDCEIKHAILGRNDAPLPGIKYCKGWGDYAGMGVSTICAYDYEETRYRVFLEDNFDRFQDLVNDTDIVIGFYSSGFDDPLCRANGIDVPDEKSWDLLAAIRKGAGVSPGSRGGGLRLNDCARANLGETKPEDGAMAPILWQRGEHGRVIDYCLEDVRLTKGLVDIVMEHGLIIDPRDMTQVIQVENP